LKVTPQRLPEILLIEPQVFRDARGYFLETHHAERYAAAGVDGVFVQDNLSSSRRGVLRGLHYQYPREQAKLISVLSGEIFDVAVDIRRGSPTFGEWVGMPLSAARHEQLFVPAGFAHGFCVVSETALVSYKCTTPYSPTDEGIVVFSDPDLAIDWPVRDVVVSDKDRAAPSLRGIASERLPRFVRPEASVQ